MFKTNIYLTLKKNNNLNKNSKINIIIYKKK